MIRLFFSGIVRPERAVLSIDNIENELRAADGSKTLIKFNAYNNQITVSVDSEEDNIYTLRNIVRSAVCRRNSNKRGRLSQGLCTTMWKS